MPVRFPPQVHPMPSPAPIVAAILAGGSSSRMGRDKALLDMDGETMLERTTRVALEVADDCFVIGRDAPTETVDPRIRYIPDEHPGEGPLGGVLTALVAAEADVMALPCDLPELSAEMVRWLGEQATHCPRAIAIIASVAGRVHPLFAVYRASAAAPLRAAFLDGERSLRRWAKRSAPARSKFPDQGVVLVDAPARWERELKGVNTPDEWKAYIAPT